MKALYIWLKTHKRYCFKKIGLIILFIIFTILDVGTFLPVVSSVEAHQSTARIDRCCVITIILFLILILFGFSFYRGLQHKNHNLFSIRLSLPKWKNLWIALFGVVCIFLYQSTIGVINVMLHLPTQTANQKVIEKMIASNHIVALTIIVGSIFLAPIVEETLYRGVFLNLFFHNHFNLLSKICSGILFGFLHYTTNFTSFLIYFGCGVIFACIYEYTKSLKTSIATHEIFNLITYL